jgi:hypothetical protein
MNKIIFQTVKVQGFLRGYGLAIDSLAWSNNKTDSFVNYINVSVNEVVLSSTQSAIFLSEEALNYTRQTAGMSRITTAMFYLSAMLTSMEQNITRQRDL